MPHTNKTGRNTFNNNRDTFSRFHANRYYNLNYYRKQYSLDTDYNNFPRNYRERQKLRTYRNTNRATAPPPLFPPRPSSPFSGTEEHNLRQIQETSDMIKKQLSMPFQEKHNSSLPPTQTQDNINNISQTDKTNKLPDKADTNKQPKSAGNKKPEKYNVGEIHDKIINHITNLSHGRKMNLIARSNYSGYDPVIERIQKKKRLELSRVLRDMCSNNQREENSDIINNIIPDFGIKIEDLPLEIIQQLSSTLDIDFQDSISSNGNNCFDYYAENEIQKIQINISDRDFKIEVKSESDPEQVFNSDIQNSSIQIKTESSEEEVVAETQSKDNCIMEEDKIETVSISTQTEDETFEKEIAKCNNLDHAIHIMFTIDKEIARLTKLRQGLFKDTKKLQIKVKPPAKAAKKMRTRAKAANEPLEKPPETQNVTKKEVEKRFETALSFQGVPSEKILVVKVLKDTILAGSESGKLFFIDLADGKTKHSIQVSNSAITSFCYHSSPQGHTDIFIGSLENNLKHLVAGQEKVTCIETKDSIQCLELAWNCIFIGSTLGNLMRFSLKKKKIEFTDKISTNGILVLKATQEGTRKVLLVGSKLTSVCVVDAMSGLHMRTMFAVYAPTIYSLLLEKSLVFCGTTVHNILVYSFHDGSLVTKYEAANSKGIGCMKIVQNLLYAGCHNGNIYVYNISKHSFVGCINGPGGVILSMEIIANIIIVGTMSSRFSSILIPASILEENN